MMRTHEAGSLRADQAGQSVTLAGWVARRRDHGGVIFIDLRDASGVAQVVFREGEMAERAHRLRAEFCVRVTGEISLRPEGNENPEIATGAIEVTATDLEVLSESAPLPFPVDEHLDVGEDVRLRHRYLDLRRSGPAKAIRMRSEANRIAREVLHGREFVEVETPTMTRSTPEGARDFLIPARLQPGSWYALPQSPQLFKQLLMVGGLERYFQIARCYRDEDFRADRQPEFTQLDIEMSFVDAEDVIDVSERVIRALWRELADHEIPAPIPRLPYAEAMARYGTDKPDLRFGVELTELTDYFRDTPFRVFQAPYVGAVVMPGGADQPRRQLDAWQEWAKQRGAKGLAYVLVGADGTLSGPVAKNLSEQERDGLAKAVGASPGDCVFFAAGQPGPSRALLGAVRLEVAENCGLVDHDAWSFVWIVDAPMFESVDDSDDVAVGAGRYTAVHHPFTAPVPEWADSFEQNPEKALANAYDLVCNGNEIGGGSVRIHRWEMQQRVFEVLGISKEEADEKFGFLLEAFRYGPPPHGGVAFGWDRICMLLSDAESLRDVIAFPKSGNGFDPLTGAPAPITAAQRKEAGVDVKPTRRGGGEAEQAGSRSS
ncbi:aspartate--tRNA ligase [Actinopolyspora sp. H202]|uniref:aspartate--tRNA ligase n=1 Tax=Actinopolyspora sp. H202 TaxID=1500456 RepID=UPI003EE45047